MTKDAHTPFGRENHRYTLSDFRIRVWWSGSKTGEIAGMIRMSPAPVAGQVKQLFLMYTLIRFLEFNPRRNIFPRYFTF